ncbi:Heterokaryon incompatibility protein (HET) domain containing protein, partial [Rhypophila decipiens]
LVPTRHEIRLLYLTPGDGDEPIHCTLEVKALNDCPEFEALSYVWGDPFAPRPITVEDATLDVTLNLYSALRRLRPKPGTTRLPLWVDAVCINQRSVKEKNHQVPMMARIYRQCKDVIAWQGEPEP